MHRSYLSSESVIYDEVNLQFQMTRLVRGTAIALLGLLADPVSDVLALRANRGSLRL